MARTPRWVRVDRNSWNIDVDKVEATSQLLPFKFESLVAWLAATNHEDRFSFAPQVLRDLDRVPESDVRTRLGRALAPFVLAALLNVPTELSLFDVVQLCDPAGVDVDIESLKMSLIS